MFDVFYSGIKPNLFAHEQAAYSIDHAWKLSRTRYFWWINYLTDYTGFDFLYEPVPWQAHQRHAWTSQWQKDAGTYLVPKQGYSETNYNKEFTLVRLPNETNWRGLGLIDISWHPDPAEPPMIYQFGTQHQRTGGPQYCVPGATDVKYVDQPRVYKTTRDNHWVTPVSADTTTFDFTWHPDDTDPPYIYQFGTQHQRIGGPQYCVPGATDVKYVDQPRVYKTTRDNHWVTPVSADTTTFDFTWHPDPAEPPMIYQFGTQHQRTGGPTYLVPGGVNVKYVDQPRVYKTTRDNHWVTPVSADTTTFDFTWHPDDTDPPYIYQFGTQHQRTGGPQYCVPGATDVKYVDQIKISTRQVATAVYEIDHMDGNAGQIPNTTRTIRYFDNYLDTLKRIAKNSEEEFIWICSSVCDYTNFDFTWHPEQWQVAMLHVFASSGEKFGDTFFMHVPTFKYRADKCQLLDWYDLNFVGTSVPRRPLPVIQHTYDTHVQAIKTIDWAGPLAVFSTDVRVNEIPTVSLWREKTKTIVPLSTGASAVVVPKSAVPYIKTQAYDYPHILRTQRHMYTDEPLDIVFIDNGEPNADVNYNHLCDSVKLKQTNLLHRSTGVNGRVAAYRAAAELSTTPWFFAVFAKLQINWAFDWNWQPDRLQEPKHYIFHARNPVNGLVYGHQAMIAYNKRLVMENNAQGLDFTLEQEHEVIPVLSGVAEYAVDAWTAWRTAFREVIKLQCNTTDIESQYRLSVWQRPGIGKFADASQQGALDAVTYYKSVNGDFAELRKTYEWEWLLTYYNLVYRIT